MCQALFSKVKDFVLFLPRLLQRLENLGGRDTKKHPQMAFRGSQGAEVMEPSMDNEWCWGLGRRTSHRITYGRTSLSCPYPIPLFSSNLHLDKTTDKTFMGPD